MNKRYNVYKQENGRLISHGRIEVAPNENALDAARESKGIRWPGIHELDGRGDEIRTRGVSE